MNRVDTEIKTRFKKLEIEIEDMSADIMANMDEKVFDFRRNIEKKAKEIANVSLNNEK